MSSYAFTDARVEVNSVVLSSWCTNVGMPSQFEQLDDTAFGDTGKSRIAGLEDSNLSLAFVQDFAAGGPDATIWAARKTVVAVKVRPTSGAISTTNPEFVGSYLVAEYDPFGNKVGDLGTTQVQWPLSDPDGIARNTA